MKPMHIELYIEELVLHGFSSGDRHHIGDAVEHELARLFTEQGLPPSLAQAIEMTHLDVGTFHVGAHLRAETVGSQIARAIYGGFNSVSHETKGMSPPRQGEGQGEDGFQMRGETSHYPHKEI